MNKIEGHILIVDDDDGIRDLVKQYLLENNFLISTAINAEDAKKKTDLVKFDLIVLDIMMPGKSGLEFIKENKSNLNNIASNLIQTNYNPFENSSLENALYITTVIRTN